MRDYSEFEPNPAAVQQLGAAVDDIFGGRSGAELFGDDVAYDADAERAALEAMYNAASHIRNDEDNLLEVEREVYAHSTRLIRKLGEAALSGAADAEVAKIVEALKSDFESSFMEMLQTDIEFRKLLEVTREREHEIIGGKVCGPMGEPMVEILERGLAYSRKAAETEPLMQTQVVCDEAQLNNAYEVDDMPVGTLRTMLAIDPKKALALNPQFWRELGYREGLAFVQAYYKVSERKLVSFAYSVDYSDLEKWRGTWTAHGGEIPADASGETLLDFAITANCKDVAEARARVAAVRHDYYQMHGLTRPVRSVDEFKAANQQAIDEVFYKLYLTLAPAKYSGDTNETVQSLARGLLKQSDNFNAQAKAQLEQLSGSSVIDGDGVRFLENAIRYGLVEHLRGRLLGGSADGSAVRGATSAGVGFVPGAASALHLVGNIADGVARGTAAGRDYGGCTKAFSVGRGESGGSGDKNKTDRELNPQDVYGGKDGTDDQATETTEAADDRAGVCVIETTGCYCCGFDSNGAPLETKLTVHAKIDARGISCMRTGCGAWMSKDGKVKIKGRIAALAESLAARAEATAPVAEKAASDARQTDARTRVAVALGLDESPAAEIKPHSMYADENVVASAELRDVRDAGEAVSEDFFDASLPLVTMPPEAETNVHAPGQLRPRSEFALAT